MAPDFADEVIEQLVTREVLQALEKLGWSIVNVAKQGTVSLVQAGGKLAQAVFKKLFPNLNPAVEEHLQTVAAIQEAIERALAGHGDTPFNFSDGVAQTVEFDVGVYEGEVKDAALGHIRESLAAEGFDPSGLVVDPSGKTALFTFDDSAAERFGRAYRNSYDAITRDPAIGKAVGYENLNVEMRGLSMLPDNLRAEFAESLNARLQEAGIEPSNVVTVPEGQKGAPSDLTVAPSGDFRSLDIAREHCKQWNLDHPGMAVTAANTMVPASARPGSDHVAERAADMVKDLQAAGIDTQAEVGRDGTMKIDIPKKDAQKAAETVLANETRHASARQIKAGRAKASLSERLEPGKKMSWKATQSHALSASRHSAARAAAAARLPKVPTVPKP